MSGAILPEHQAETEAAATAAEVTGGGHDEEKDGSDER